MARHGYAPSVSSESSGGSRSSSRSSLSSTSSTRTRVSEVTQKQIKPEGWRQKMLMYTACTNPKRPMALRRSTIEVYADDFGDGDDDASISSELLETYYTYAWITQGGWYDNGASVTSSSSKHGSSTRAKRERYAAHQRRAAAPPPPRQAPPPPGPHFMGSAPPPPPGHGHPFMDPNAGMDFYDFPDDGHLDAEPGFVDLSGMAGPPPPPPPPPSGGGNPGFIDLNAQGGGAPAGRGKPGKYDDWDD